jgi:thiol-disulfide isomerase/thioredoxin
MLRFRLPLLLACLTVAASSTAAPPPPPAVDLAELREVGRAYRSFASYDMSGTLTIEVEAEGQPRQSVVAPFRMAAVRPGRVFEHVDHAQIGVLTVSDGATTWIYSPARRQYLQQTGPGPDAADSATASRGSLAASLLSNYRGILDGVTAARELPAETLRFAGLDRAVRVLEVTYAGAGVAEEMVKTFWLDRETGRVLRHRIENAVWGGEGAERRRVGRRVETVGYDRLEFGGRVPDSLFAFTPPPGSSEMERPGAGRPSLAGRPAIDFTLKDLAGKEHRLGSHRGQVVMLDFWATWCGPCRIQMPLVEKLGREYADRGLVVYAVNQGEPAEKARAYLKKNSYTTTALLDPKSEVGGRYGVTGIPTLVVIDRQGTIAAHFVGVRGEAELREALKKAGLE